MPDTTPERDAFRPEQIPTRKPWHRTGDATPSARYTGTRWSLTLGFPGLSVRVMQRVPNGPFYRVLEQPGDRQNWKSLGTDNRAEAERRARLFLHALIAPGTRQDGSAGVRSPDDHGHPAGTAERPPHPETAPERAHLLTLREVADLYLGTSARHLANAPKTRADTVARVAWLTRGLGADRTVVSLTANDADRYAMMRRTGTGWPDGNPSRPTRSARSAQADLQVLLAMLAFATKARTANGERVLHDHPLRGYSLPEEQNPRLPLTTYDRFARSRAALADFAEEAWAEGATDEWRVWRLTDLALVLAEATGRRIGAIRQLDWGDIDRPERRIAWRPEADKRHIRGDIPAPSTLIATLTAFARELAPAHGPVFARVPGQADTVCDTDTLADRLLRAEERAGLTKLEGGVWHPYRRKFATERQHHPLQAVMDAGGWRDSETLRKCYLKSTDDLLEAVMTTPMKVVRHDGRYTLAEPRSQPNASPERT